MKDGVELIIYKHTNSMTAVGIAHPLHEREQWGAANGSRNRN